VREAARAAGNYKEREIEDFLERKRERGFSRGKTHVRRLERKPQNPKTENES
jgi:hypothetical protein